MLTALPTRVRALDFKRLRRLSKEFGWIVAGQVATVLGALVLVRVLTEYLEPAEYGRLTLTLTLGVLVCQTAFAGSMPGIMRYYTLAAEQQRKGAYFHASRQVLLSSVGIAFGLGGLLLIALAVWGRTDLLGLTILTVLLSVLSSLNSTQSMIQNAARQRHVVALHAGLDSWLKMALAALLIVWLGAAAELAVLAYILSVLIVLASQGVFIRRLIPRQPANAAEHSEWRRLIWHYSKPFLAFNALTWLQASSDRWALDTLAGTAEVGLYATLLQLGYAPISMLTGMATTLIGPILFGRSGDAQDAVRNQGVLRLSWRLTTLALGLTTLGFALAWVLHPLIFRFLVAEEYRAVSYLLPWMIVAGGLFAASQVLALKMMSELNTYAMLWPKIVTALLGTAFSFAGAYMAGLTGVVVGMVGFSLAHFLWLAALTLRCGQPTGISISDKL